MFVLKVIAVFFFFFGNSGEVEATGGTNSILFTDVTP